LASYILAFAFTTEEKARKNLSQGSRRVSFGTMKTEFRESLKINSETKLNISDKNVFVDGKVTLKLCTAV
jgi:hypothetical protein